MSMLSRLRMLGDFAGQDKTGKAFSSQWDPSVQGTGDLLMGFMESMRKVTEGLTNTALLYEKANNINSQIVGHPTVVR